MSGSTEPSRDALLALLSVVRSSQADADHVFAAAREELANLERTLEEAEQKTASLKVELALARERVQKLDKIAQKDAQFQEEKAQFSAYEETLKAHWYGRVADAESNAAVQLAEAAKLKAQFHLHYWQNVLRDASQKATEEGRVAVKETAKLVDELSSSDDRKQAYMAMMQEKLKSAQEETAAMLARTAATEAKITTYQGLLQTRREEVCSAAEMLKEREAAVKDLEDTKRDLDEFYQAQLKRLPDEVAALKAS